MNVLENKEISEWLQELQTASTTKRFSYGIKGFFEWYGKPVEDFIKLNRKKMRHLALVFQTYLSKQGKPDNTVRGYITALKCFCAYLDKPLNLRGKIVKIRPDVTSHVFRNGDLKAMFSVGDTKEKAILATFASLGWEIEGVLELDRVFIERQLEIAKEKGERFIFFDAIREKTQVLRLGILNPLAIEWLEKWLRTPQSKKSEKVFDMTLEGVNKLIRRLAVESKVINSKLPKELAKTRERIHSHLIRKWVMSQLSRAGFNEWEVKFVVGKAIPLSDSTYLTSLKDAIEEKYPKIYEEYLNINPAIVRVEVKTEDFKRVEAKQMDIEKQLEEANKRYEQLLAMNKSLAAEIHRRDKGKTEEIET